MKLQQLKQFVTLAEAQNFHRAAERLNMAQPPLSISIRKLEEELGAPLFSRGQRGVQLTTAGAAALDEARQALFHAEQLQRAVRDTISGERGGLRIGFVGSATYTLLPRLLPAFRARFPQIDVTLEESRTADLLRALETGAIDVAIVRTPVLSETRVEIFPLEADRLMVAAPRHGRFAGRKRIRLEELRSDPFVVYARDTVPSMHAIAMLACQQAGFVPHIAEQAIQAQSIICLVESGFGVALVPGVVGRRNQGSVQLMEIEGPGGDAAIGLGVAIGGPRPGGSATRFRDFVVRLPLD